MKKLLSLLLSIFCIFSFNTCFKINYVAAAPEPTQQELPELPMDGQVDDDVLREPIFNPEKKKKEPNKIGLKMKSILVQLLCGIALVVVIVFCGSFVWFANLQRRGNERRKKQSANTNVIDAVDNFARRRIK
ncbi:MAG: hypothetical protein K6A44_07175 [bacterium]|nr:hypothetical protein [bacterium]